MSGFDDYRSKANRQDLDVVHIQQAYLDASQRQQQRREELDGGCCPIVASDAEIDDWRICMRYEESFGPRASSMTVDRGKIFWKK